MSVSESDPWEITIGTEKFETSCREMNLLVHDVNAVAKFDGMSGAFKFSDELPRSFTDPLNDLSLPMVSLLRCLWAYRFSLVEGKPRTELQSWWEATKSAAPDWPGFLPVRCSGAMLPVVKECLVKQDELTRGLDELDEACNVRKPLN